MIHHPRPVPLTREQIIAALLIQARRQQHSDPVVADIMTQAAVLLQKEAL